MVGRKWTLEQRKAASERFKARSAPAESLAEIQEEEDEDVFGQLIATLSKAKAKRGNSKKLLDDAAALLAQIDFKANPELSEDPVIEGLLEKIGTQRATKAAQEGAPPGTVIYQTDARTGQQVPMSDIPWKLSDVNLLPDGSKELVTWTPNETIPIFYNGVMCQAIADMPMTTEKAFMDVYLEHKRLTQIGNQHKQYMFGRSPNLPAELATTDAAVSTARIRAFMAAGGEYGGGRITQGYPGDAVFELRDVPGGTTSGETPTQ